MPIYESVCRQPSCHRRGVVVEGYFPLTTSPSPICECGETMARLVSKPQILWTKSLAEMGDKRKETYDKDLRRGGHWVARKRSGGGTEKNPKFELIETRQQQKEYCKSEGLTDPTDFSPNVRVSQDGKSFSSGVGEPGCWT